MVRRYTSTARSTYGGEAFSAHLSTKRTILSEMGSAASVETKNYGQEIRSSLIHKNETSYSSGIRSSKSKNHQFDPLIQEMRFDKIWSEHADVPEPVEEDFGKELREINKEETMKICPEISQHKYGRRVWDTISKENPDRLHFYEYLASYPCCESLQDRSKFVMKLLSLFIGEEERIVAPNQEPVFTLLDLGKLLFNYESNVNTSTKKEFDKARYLTLGAALLAQTRQGHYFKDESVNLDLDLIMYRKFKHEPFDDILDRLSVYQIDANIFSRLVVSTLRIMNQTELNESEWNLNDGGCALSRQPELMLPTPRQ